ncbi:HNH endonuclease signature motif containing protein [Mycobacterium camsae]|uniref:HNH endonuclease signature motif containing protein n=1 Tax=Mycobacterium gordonae TaxID=1778 RepID=UPI00197E0942|nr:HNH endonuclease signature motif containing protein [Mycobacterium gordonae]
MASSTREEIVEVFNLLDAAVDRLCDLTFDAFTAPEFMRGTERLEKAVRRLRTPQHTLINHLHTQATEEELGGKLRAALADRLRITRAEAGRRIAEAHDLGQRRALTGEPLAPLLTATAKAQRQGLIGDAHIKVIRTFIAHLPSSIDVGTWEAAEADLAGKACDFRPDQVSKYAHELMALLHPDGDYTEEERARKRALILGPQQYDGMSRIGGLITPELRALIEAAWAKLAAPGAGVPDGDTDARSQPQRNHDAMVTAIRTLLATNDLGTHHGLPVSIIVTTTLKDLEAGAGKARTAGGTLVPMSQLIRWAAQAHHYLAVFDRAKPLALFHTKRFANLAQRMMLLAKDGGCTRPGCTIPGYQTEVHHVTRWTATHYTDIDDLTLACGIDNRLAETGWTTRKNAKGETEWLPPAHLDHGQPRINTFHHPEKLLAPDDDEPG